MTTTWTSCKMDARPVLDQQDGSKDYSEVDADDHGGEAMIGAVIIAIDSLAETVPDHPGHDGHS